MNAFAIELSYKNVNYGQFKASRTKSAQPLMTNMIAYATYYRKLLLVTITDRVVAFLPAYLQKPHSSAQKSHTFHPYMCSLAINITCTCAFIVIACVTLCGFCLSIEQLPDKPVSCLVKYYYLWKRAYSQYSLLDKHSRRNGKKIRYVQSGRVHYSCFKGCLYRILLLSCFLLEFF